jgi:hypothetical protein
MLPQNDSNHFSRIGHKLLNLAARYPSQLDPLTPKVLDLEVGLDHARMSLPKPAVVAPNQHSWPETMVVMGVKPKTKRKHQTDPYSGGEKSGKKAKPDARDASNGKGMER